ncbi:MAG: replication-associated recombination protein A [Hyphomicrobiales bacterium]|nr:replication-associated recombination protein A [Rickettsiales bacterium]MCP5361031.1 replication-associated recombination protein A [Hyphomicrobiales bacterium]
MEPLSLGLDEPAQPEHAKGYRPLAERMRPRVLKDIIGQEAVLAEGTQLHLALKQGQVPSLILWGPPGCGKTTLARVLAEQGEYHFASLSAVSHATADLKKVFEQAEKRHRQGQNTLLLVDEIHRFNRTQQDLFLPYIENGTITLIGATTENPSFELNPALLSRCRVLVLKRLEDDALLMLVERAEAFEKRTLPLDEAARSALPKLADGDGRYLLNLCEALFALPEGEILDTEKLGAFVQHRLPVYDKHQDSHYNLISALHKSLRGSDVDAALYWLARMLDGGENPLYIVRRLVRFAVEDIGLADPEAVHQALAAKEAYDFLGSPEGELAIMQATVYLATAPKSNAVYKASKAVMRDAKTHGSLMPPKHILNAPTKLMKEEGYGKDYAYDHDTKEGFSGQNYFPEAMERQHYYQPVARGFEREIQKRLEYWAKLRKEKAEA